MPSHSIQSEANSRGARMLRSALGTAIAGYLEDEAIIEVMLNPDGRLWIDRLSSGLIDTGKTLRSGWRAHCSPVAHPRRCGGACRGATASAELPGTGERFEGLLPPVVAAPAFAIRNQRSRCLPSTITSPKS